MELIGEVQEQFQLRIINYGRSSYRGYQNPSLTTFG